MELLTSMIRAFRHIATGGNTRQLKGLSRHAAYVARLLALLSIFVFFLDTINADILYAALAGDVRFEDNPLIVDSATDQTSVVPALAVHVNYFALAKYDGGSSSMAKRIIPRFYGMTILEDVDSPTVLDGESTESLTASTVKHSFANPRSAGASLFATRDRTITYGRLLI